MAYQYYLDIANPATDVNSSHPEFLAISEMRTLPRERWSRFIEYAMTHHRCDLIRHWIANGAKPNSDLWLTELAAGYEPALLPVLPLLLDTRPLDLIAARVLLQCPEVRPYLANYLHKLPIELLIDANDLEQVQFLSKVFDVSAPIILWTATNAPKRNLGVIRFLYERCADLEYKDYDIPMTINETLAVLFIGVCLVEEAQLLVDAVSEQFRDFIQSLVSYDVRVGVEPLDKEVLAVLMGQLLSYKGPPLAQLMAESIASVAGWLGMRHPPATFDYPPEDPRYPLVWLLVHHPHLATEERIRSATRNQCICARLAKERLSARTNQLILDRLG